MRPDFSGMSEPLRLVDGGAEGECRDRADARHTHQPPADRLAAYNDENLTGQPVELLRHGDQDRQHGCDKRQDQGIVAYHFPNTRGKGCASRRAEFGPTLA